MRKHDITLVVRFWILLVIPDSENCAVKVGREELGRFVPENFANCVVCKKKLWVGRSDPGSREIVVNTD